MLQQDSDLRRALLAITRLESTPPSNYATELNCDFCCTKQTAFSRVPRCWTVTLQATLAHWLRFAITLCRNMSEPGRERLTHHGPWMNETFLFNQRMLCELYEQQQQVNSHWVSCCYVVIRMSLYLLTDTNCIEESQELRIFLGPRRLFTVFTTACHFFLS